MRVIDGLEGAAAANSQSFDRAQMDTLLSGLGKRVFVHPIRNDLFGRACHVCVQRFDGQ